MTPEPRGGAPSPQFEGPPDPHPKIAGKKPLGTVISTEENPTTVDFAFVLEKEAGVKKNQFVQTANHEGTVFGLLKEITRANRYFERAESVAEYEKEGPISAHFPVDSWEYTVGEVKILGLMLEQGGKYRNWRVSLPPSPGAKVLPAPDRMLKDFVGFRENGLMLGKLQNHDVDAKIDMTRLLQKHLAVLAQSGAGKSHTVAVMLEELLDRKAEDGRISVVIIDIHGEYAGFKSDPNYSRRTRVIAGRDISVPFSHLSPGMLGTWFPNMSGPARQEVAKILKAMHSESKTTRQLFGLKDLIDRVLSSGIHQNVKGTILRDLYELQAMRFIHPSKQKPNLYEAVKPGEMLVLDLSDLDEATKKKLLVTYIASRLFKLRKKEKIPPFLLVVEEAHNFAPEKVKMAHSPSKSIIEKIAREGRKFGAALCVVSQRPVQLSTTTLSQCNTHLILRVTNPNDLDHIGKSSEGIDSTMLRSITGLKVGEGIIVGEAVNYPIFVEIRDRKSKKMERGRPLHEQAISFEKEERRKEEEEDEELEAFL